MSTFDPTARVNAIRDAAEKAKAMVDARAKKKIDAIYCPPGSVEITRNVSRTTDEIWELARKWKLEINLKATAEINEVWAEWNEAEAKERKRKKK